MKKDKVFLKKIISSATIFAKPNISTKHHIGNFFDEMPKILALTPNCIRRHFEIEQPLNATFPTDLPLVNVPQDEEVVLSFRELDAKICTFLQQQPTKKRKLEQGHRIDSLMSGDKPYIMGSTGSAICLICIAMGKDKNGESVFGVSHHVDYIPFKEFSEAFTRRGVSSVTLEVIAPISNSREAIDDNISQLEEEPTLKAFFSDININISFPEFTLDSDDDDEILGLLGNKVLQSAGVSAYISILSFGELDFDYTINIETEIEDLSGVIKTKTDVIQYYDN
jgi:hypothetical protein